MKFSAAALCLLATGTASAFSPKPFVSRNSGLMVPQSSSEDPASNSPLLWRPPNMVAGGAERAYGQEYYEGRLVIGKTESVGPFFVWTLLSTWTPSHPPSMVPFCVHKCVNDRCRHRSTPRSPFPPPTQPHCVHWYALGPRRY